MDLNNDISQQSSPGSIFSQPWWLEAVAPQSWGEVRIEKGGTLHARLPYVIQKNLGLKMLVMPPLTQTLGPWLRPYPGKYTNRLSEEKRLMTELIEQLPTFDLFQQSFDHLVTNWLPFYWQGFQQTTRYTYRLEDLTNLENMWSHARKNVRTDICKAQGSLVVHSDATLDNFLDLNGKTFANQGLASPYERELVYRLDQACEEQKCRKMFFAEDSQGRLHAAIYLVWNDETAYYLMGGGDPELRTSGATSLLVWEAIKFAATVTRTFDFEGSMIEPIERFFRAFGAKQKPYFRVTKTNALTFKMFQDIKSWGKMFRDSLKG